MKNVLVVLPPALSAPRAVAYALERAKELGGGLIALVVLDPDQRDRVATTLTNIGWVGERVNESVVGTLAREERTQAEAELAAIVQRALAEGIAATPVIEEGDPSDVCTRVIRQRQVGVAVLAAEKQSWLARLLARSAPLQLPHVPDCEIKVVDED